MKTIVGCNFLAKENTARTSLFESPYHFSVKVEIWRLMKQAPYRRTPDGAARSDDECEYKCGIVRG
jgi:hypothetical protein